MEMEMEIFIFSAFTCSKSVTVVRNLGFDCG